MRTKITFGLLTALLLFNCLPSQAYDFDALEKQVQNGDITREQMMQTIHQAIQSGEITRDDLNQRMNKMQGQRGHRRHHRQMGTSQNDSGYQQNSQNRPPGPKRAMGAMQGNSNFHNPPPNRPPRNNRMQNQQNQYNMPYNNDIIYNPRPANSNSNDTDTNTTY